MRLGTPGPHDVGPRVRAAPGPTVPPPDVFARFEGDAFWENPVWENPVNPPASVRVL